MPGKTSGRKLTRSTRSVRESKEVKEVVREVAREARAVQTPAPVETKPVEEAMPETQPEPVAVAAPPPPPVLPVLDLRNCKPIEARAKAFQGMFRVKPGQKVAVYINTVEVEREVMKWVNEIGHRFIKNFRVENNGSAFLTIELIKMEARR